MFNCIHTFGFFAKKSRLNFFNLSKRIKMATFTLPTNLASVENYIGAMYGNAIGSATMLKSTEF